MFAGDLSGYSEPPPTAKTRKAYEEVLAWAVAISQEAGLDGWAAELLPAEVQRAYELAKAGPNMTALVVDRMSILIDPSGNGALEVVARVADSRVLADASSKATQWMLDAVIAAQIAPDNPFGGV